MDYIPFPGDGTDFNEWVGSTASHDLIEANREYLGIMSEAIHLIPRDGDFTDPEIIDEIEPHVFCLLELSPWVVAIQQELSCRYTDIAKEAETGEVTKSRN